ncbi:WcaA Glycosyltransferases involved in cell wall biogenesis [uncultured Caudovirales phage]|uniref:WcaA Glycosyltransferases involved in cell wall biogenesis n=1 Tax=uncultured Caudovirales phage TaxID=2100421 RepID=A0A6J5RSH4_9CAUD|nr:WcaA Glycosyltransferases involved in cell wall biogenesis [uncultured Caudovirales phage]
MNKILSIVIPVYNKFPFTKSCLNDLLKLSDNHEIIIIDNGSTDETKKELENNSKIIYYRFDNNQGFAKACNKGYQISSSNNVLFLNNDIRVKSNYESWTNILIDKCELGLVGPTMGQLDKELNFIKESNSKLNGNSYMSGWCLAASKNIWNKLIINNYLGPFSEEFFCYFEDTDLGFRSKKNGIAMNIVDIPVVHFGKQTSKQLNTYELYKSARKIFVNKWGK